MTAEQIAIPVGTVSSSPLLRSVDMTAPGAVPVVNLPNALTVLRLLCVPVLAVLLVGSVTYGDSWLVAAWAVFTAACVTDVVDGRLARSRGLCTDFGAFADPIADKTLVGTALSACPGWGSCPGGSPP